MLKPENESVTLKLFRDHDWISWGGESTEYDTHLFTRGDLKLNAVNLGAGYDDDGDFFRTIVIVSPNLTSEH